MENAVCRICLAQNIRMHPIVNTEIQAVFEQITNYLLVTEGRPLLACYICYTRLKQCHQLRVKCSQAEEIFAQMMKGKQLNKNLIGKLSSVNTLFMTPVQHVPAGDMCTGTTDVKQEAVSEESDDEEQMKVEVVDNEVSFSTPNVKEDELVLDQTQTQAENHHILTESGPPQSDLDTTTWSEPELLTVRKTKKCKDRELNVGGTTMLQCSKDGKRQSAICDSKMSSSNIFSYKCTVCQKCYKHKSDLNEHICANSGAYICDMCQKSFRQKATLRKHFRVHTGVRRYRCDVCQESFRVKDSLRKHFRVHTDVQPYKCDLCQKCFSGKSNLNRHLRVHTGIKPFKCAVCQKCFSDKSNLNIHLRVHTSIKSFKCAVCEKCFRYKSNLNMHLRVHTSMKPYKCDVCKKCFRVKDSLIKHLRIHTGLRPYKCDVCQKCFSQKSNLNKHLRVHIGVRPYKCDVCTKCFREKDSLNSHLRLHTGVRPFKCIVCHKGFTANCYLNRHLRRHTGINIKIDQIRKMKPRNRSLKKERV